MIGKKWIWSQLLRFLALCSFESKHLKVMQRPCIGSPLTCSISTFMEYHCLCDPSLGPGPAAGSVACWDGELSQTYCSLGRATTGACGCVTLSSGPPFWNEDGSCSSASFCMCICHLPTGARGFSRRVVPTGTPSILVCIRNMLVEVNLLIVVIYCTVYHIKGGL